METKEELCPKVKKCGKRRGKNEKKQQKGSVRKYY